MVPPVVWVEPELSQLLVSMAAMAALVVRVVMLVPQELVVHWVALVVLALMVEMASKVGTPQYLPLA